MSAAVAKLMNPAFYKQQWANTCARAYAKYHPTIRENKATVLFHSMLAISFTMYTGTYIARVYPEKQEERAIKKQALHEYYEKHGGAPHH
mmetsp:Transcript_5702/g.14146  ORF Transcript_5702/g.14146 Transcript_5702/m.14146 type:complete len:90 (-) Transcript_5702:428-697(-)|eukprot:CAMPEP_0172390280 /NCGR_PEP_ID=MMETSP1061-20121228/6949_1 /TAXON_ID=37318 /ORGANISM="Pseudo-nitzschia pungens, Strain cf. pungens" /LENGTH=89 /DNA_ID=CAMNT_0013120595 /DNA_START=182 /DNA_END=451 /DNA_ORIENTATION=-